MGMHGDEINADLYVDLCWFSPRDFGLGFEKFGSIGLWIMKTLSFRLKPVFLN